MNSGGMFVSEPPPTAPAPAPVRSPPARPPRPAVINTCTSHRGVETHHAVHSKGEPADARTGEQADAVVGSFFVWAFVREK